MDRCLFLSLVMIGCLSIPATGQTSFEVDETDNVTLGAGSHPAAGADIGRTPPNLFLQHLSLIVAPSPLQHIGPSITNAPAWPGSTARGFDTLNSDSYPERDGQHAVIGWLRSHGFAVEPPRNPRFPVRFSGKVAQLEEVFRVEIHNYISGGRVYHANASPPSIPRAFAGSIRAVNLQDGPHRNSALNPQGSISTVLYDFTGTPYDAVLGGITDEAGNLYGTTPGGGAAGLGAIFKVDMSGKETFLYSFTAGNGDGISPNPGLSMDSAGNLYGTTFLGGSKNGGTVFKFDPTGHETVLYSFTGGADGGTPTGGVAIDSAGNIYGTTSSGGVTGVCCGAVFKLDPTGHEKLLHSFTGANGDGTYPNGGLVLDGVGNIYGTTYSGGVTGDCCGTVFKVDPAGNETVLHSFLLANQGNDGGDPLDGVILDSAGNIYGTTSSRSTVFKLDPTGHETILYEFTGTNGDGASPQTGLIKDSQGNLYGTTYGGGIYNGCPFGCGTVFKVDPTGQETVLYKFTGGSDGGSPNSGLIMDSAGNLYGSNQLYSQPSAANPTVVFKVDPAGHASALYTFPVTNGDGAGPTGGLVIDSAGNLYGTTQFGGDTRCGDLSFSGCGTAFKLDASTGHESVLYSFTGANGDGATPTGGLIMDAAGNLYGTTQGGGSTLCLFLGCGTVFKLDPTGHETVLYSFTGGDADGAEPTAPLVMDAAGNLYGTTLEGGGTVCGSLIGLSGCGTVFKLDPTGHETVLYRFTDSNGDGAEPTAPLVVDAAGNLYGTTHFGGDTHCGLYQIGCGIVFKLDPTGHETVLHTFTGANGDVGNPFGLISDSAGNLYGPTSGGTVFKVDPAGHETILYSFTGNDGSPNGALILDSAGNLYGTTQPGGDTLCGFGLGCGTVFKLDPAGHESVLYSFTGANGDGATPSGALVMDSSGIVYGSTAEGGYGMNLVDGFTQIGTVFALAPATDFWLAVAKGGSASATVTAGQTATYNLQLNSVSGFSGTVVLSCSGMPAQAVCSVSPSTLTVSNGSGLPFVVTVTTAVRPSMASETHGGPDAPLPGRSYAFLLIACGLLSFIGLMTRHANSRRTCAPISALACLTLTLLACGGGSSKNGGNGGTPAGTYSLTVTGSEQGTNRTMTLTLTVN